MATLTIKNLPDEIYRSLSETAKRHRRSINSEAIVQLEQGLRNSDPGIDTTIESVRKMRERLQENGVWLTDDILDRAKNEGRS